MTHHTGSDEGPDVDALAQEIRRVDGNHDLGAGALAEALLPFLAARAAAPDALRERIAAIEHDDWCDANGCRCGKCPCLGAPWCVIPPEPTTD